MKERERLLPVKDKKCARCVVGCVVVAVVVVVLVKMSANGAVRVLCVWPFGWCHGMWLAGARSLASHWMSYEKSYQDPVAERTNSRPTSDLASRPQDFFFGKLALKIDRRRDCHQAPQQKSPNKKEAPRTIPSSLVWCKSRSKHPSIHLSYFLAHFVPNFLISQVLQSKQKMKSFLSFLSLATAAQAFVPTRPQSMTTPLAMSADDSQDGPILNKYSRTLTQNKKQGAAQAMLYATGLQEEDMAKPQVGVCSVWYEGE